MAREKYGCESIHADDDTMTTIVRVTAAIISNDGRILITQRLPNDRFAGFWEFPGGKVENGESPEECLKRELWEELEMEAVIGTPLGSSIYHYDHISIELMVFRAYWNGRPFKLVTHQASRWILPARLVDFQYTPADLPFVHRLASGEIIIE